MTYTQFKNEWNGKKIGNGQCKILFNQYNKDVVGGKRIYGNAKDLWNVYDTAKYTKIKNTLTFVPKTGDVMIWGAWKENPYGHVAIVDSANVFWFTSFEQNWPVGSVAHLQKHNYVSPPVLGVLRPKSITL